MRIIFRHFFVAFFVFLLLPFVTRSAMAASLGFDKTSYSVAVGDTFQVNVVVNPGTDEITSVDAYVKYDSSILSAQTVTPGSYFTTVLNDLTTGKAYVAGLVDNPSDFKTGTGTVATIIFKAVANGTVTLTYDCEATATNTSKIIQNDINSTNIIDCAENTSALVSAGTGSASGGGLGGSNSATVTPKISQLPQSGVIENMMSIAVPGLTLVFLSGILQLLKKV